MKKQYSIFLISLMVLSGVPMAANALALTEDVPPVQLIDGYNRNFLDILAPPGGCSPWPSCRDEGGEDPGDEDPESNQEKDWGYMRIGSDLARAKASGMAIVAVLDTGVEADNNDLQGLLVGCFSGIKRSNYNCDHREVKDQNGHGTHVAATIAALDNNIDIVGVAAGHVGIINGKVLGQQGSSWDDLAWSIRHAADLGADVISMSLGGDISSSTSTQQMLQDAADYARSKAAVLVAAAGNSGTCGDTGYQWSWPAATNGVIAVGATGLYKDGAWATEWTGAEQDVMPCFSNEGPYLDIAAPGVYITSLKHQGGTTDMSGTSMAAPHVAAVLALLLAKGYSQTQATNRIYSTAIDIGYRSTLQGHGLIDAEAALK
jgi:subtilisin family serine protease